MPQARTDLVELPDLPPPMSRCGRWAGALPGKMILKALGWKAKGAFPETAPFVLVAAPHTSNRDGVAALSAAVAQGIEVSFFARRGAFRGRRVLPSDAQRSASPARTPLQSRSVSRRVYVVRAEGPGVRASLTLTVVR